MVAIVGGTANDSIAELVCLVVSQAALRVIDMQVEPKL